MASNIRARLEPWLDGLWVKPGQKVNLAKDFDPRQDFGLKKDDPDNDLGHCVDRLAEFQEKLYAEDRQSLLVIFQARDAAGKDSAIKHVMSGLNPQGCHVAVFKAPTSIELDHDYLWRHVRQLPERGRIGIHNRSHYEEVLVTKVHPEIIQGQRLPEHLKNGKIYERRFKAIRHFEEHLADNGTQIVKFFLNVSKEEQRQRFLERIDRPEKNWKFALGDVEERKHWDAYTEAYESMLEQTSTERCPWYVIPADRKWVTRLAVAAILLMHLEEMDPQFPAFDAAKLDELAVARRLLESEA